MGKCYFCGKPATKNAWTEEIFICDVCDEESSKELNCPEYKYGGECLMNLPGRCIKYGNICCVFCEEFKTCEHPCDMYLK